MQFKNKKISFYYLLSFIEGGMMLVTELASARKIAVFFGSSLYVWLIVLCTTLLGLAAGYYWANDVIIKNKNSHPRFEKKLATLFALLSMELMIWKFNSNICLALINGQLGLIESVIIDGLILLALPMFSYGAITTLLIHIAQKQTSNPVYGKILGYSTLGSIVFAVLAVIIAFPYLGVQTSIYILSFLSILISIMLRTSRQWLGIILITMLFISEKKIQKNILYENDGAFSNVMVIEENNTRYLMVNYIIQTFEDIKNHRTLKYAEIIDSIFQQKKILNKKVLILGLGGGMLANILSDNTSKITGVEIDPRIIDCAKKYFHLNENVQTICEDAQWFIQKNNQKYDITIMDLFNGEEPPAYLLTKENFLKIKEQMTNDSSLLVINWYGYYSGNAGKGTRILINTLHQCGFYTAQIMTAALEDRSNLIIFASKYPSLLPNNSINFSTENVINTADKNILSFLNAEANFLWRKNYLYFIQHWWK